MTDADVEVVLQRACEHYPEERPRIISDNGPQFIARDFKEYIRIMGMTNVRTSPYYPQSNGKIERWYQSLKRECIRPKTPISLDDARRFAGEFIEYYNTEHLHSSIGYITPKDKLEGKEKTIFEERDYTLAVARERRKAQRKKAREQLRGSTCQGCEASEGPGLDSHRKYLVIEGGENPP